VEAYDAAVIGAGAEGLSAAITLARAGLSTIVLERNATPGGRCRTVTFHEGFRASLFSDEISPIPPQIFHSLGLSGKGVLFSPAAATSALWPDRRRNFSLAERWSSAGVLWHEARKARSAVCARASKVPASYARRFFPLRKPEPWPGETWGEISLEAVLRERIADRDLCAHLAALALEGQAADPLLNGTASHALVSSSRSGVPRRGLESLTVALVALAQEAGASLSCGLEVADIRHDKERIRGVVLADGTEISAPIVISTLDPKRTFLSLFKWESLPGVTRERARVFRFAGATARLLLALERPPEGLDPAAMRGAISIAPDIDGFTTAYGAWRAGTLPAAPGLIVRFPSAFDPSMAPEGAATMTVTVGGAPHRFFDGGWSHARCEEFRKLILSQIETVMPGTSARVLGWKLVVPSDVEDALGRTDGDLAGGEISADQMFGARPWAQAGLEPPMTPFRGLYLAGPSTMLGLLSTCASGIAAANAAVAQSGNGWLK